jgi:hypothetical protein
MGGLLVATLLTILFVLALHASWLCQSVPRNAEKPVS